MRQLTRIRRPKTGPPETLAQARAADKLSVGQSGCPRHKYCAYTGLEPGRCPTCHTSLGKCAGTHGMRPQDSSWDPRGVASASHPTLFEGQPKDPLAMCTGDRFTPTIPT